MVTEIHVGGGKFRLEEATGEEWKFHTAFIGTLDNE
jgi:hypothetical protein